MGFSQKFKAIFRHRIVWLTVTPIVAGIVISLLVFARQANPPVAELPEVIDLGAREIGDVVVVPFSIANRGGEELVIDDIRTSCSCSGIEREIEGKPESRRAQRAGYPNSGARSSCGNCAAHCRLFSHQRPENTGRAN
jgi:hypothetical protein